MKKNVYIEILCGLLNPLCASSIEFCDGSELISPYDLVRAVRDPFTHSVLQSCMPHKIQASKRVCVVLYLIRSLLILLLIPGI